ncbi:MAG TPA: hypothetical protein VD793_09600 [Gemmatimonadales bacterium]|nr:hypothetical protein [Gemmatimonadales bacterium]
MSCVSGLRTSLIAAGLVVALVSVPVAASAQTTDSDDISAIALVVGVAPLNVTGVNDLFFGSVTQGTTGIIADTAANGGRWDVTGEPSAAVSVSFTLPTVLTGPGPDVPIAFSAGDGVHWTTYPTAYTTFNPNALYSTSLTGLGTLTIGIVGTVSPGTPTSTGTYTGTVTLTVSYL